MGMLDGKGGLELTCNLNPEASSCAFLLGRRLHPGSSPNH
jgi:hypothetical protein